MVSWQIASSLDRDYILELAALEGWYDDPPKVQVKKILGMNYEEWYILEPYEKDCNCPQLISPPPIAQK